MQLYSLRFERRTYEITSPLVGAAIFKSEDSQIALTLTDEQAKRVLDICAESLEAELTKSVTAMKNSLVVTLEKRKAEKIGATLPNYF